MEKWHGTNTGYTNHGCRCAACREAKRQAAAAYRAANREKVNEAKRRQYENDRERVLERNRAWREANAEQVRAADRVRAVKNRGRKSEYDRARYEANKPDAIARAKRWGEANRGRKNASARKRRAADPERSRSGYRAAWRRARERNPDVGRETFKRWAASPEGQAYFRWQRQTRKDALTDEWTKDWLAVLAGDPCSYCGGSAREVDHIVAGVPRDSRWSNLAPACRSCNSSKRDTRLLLWLQRRKEVA